MNDEEPICDVCRINQAIGVAASVTGAISFAYCVDCLFAGVEPYDALIGGCIGLGKNEVADWYKQRIDATLVFLGITEDKFWADVEQMTADYYKEMGYE